MGDTATSICDHETSIMLALSGHIVAQTTMLIEFSHLVSQLDCLQAFATASNILGWVRPLISEDGVMEIHEGKHPLQEQCVPTFVPNDTNIVRGVHKLRRLKGWTDYLSKNDVWIFGFFIYSCLL